MITVWYFEEASMFAIYCTKTAAFFNDYILPLKLDVEMMTGFGSAPTNHNYVKIGEYNNIDDYNDNFFNDFAELMV